MKSLVLTTSSNETQKYSQGLEQFGEVNTLIYDIPGSSEQLLYERAREYAPDLLVYIGSRWGMHPSQSTLSQLNGKVAPMVHFCSDAADYPWHDLLREYHNQGCFSLQLNIDGSSKWPGATTGLTLLTPVDPKYFPTVIPPHAERSIACGFAGNTGGGPVSKRTVTLSKLLEKRVLDMRVRSPLPFTYEGYCEYLTRCRISLNIAYSGTEQTTQCKGRVIESALAGACLLETAGAPTKDWFIPGEDYLEYHSIEEAADIAQNLSPVVSQVMADKLRAKVLAGHSPAMFWAKVFDKLRISP